jgi:hypothetical protein
MSRRAGRRPGRSVATVTGVIAALAVVASGCTAETAAPQAPLQVDTAAGEQMSGHAGMTAPVLYAVLSGPLGVVVIDGDGRLLYRFEQDSTEPPTSRCTDVCTGSWQPMTVDDGQMPEPLGVARPWWAPSPGPTARRR